MRTVAVLVALILIACGGEQPGSTTVRLKWEAARAATCGQQRVTCNGTFVVEASYAPYVVDFYYPQCKVAHDTGTFSIDCSGMCSSLPASGCSGWTYKCPQIWLAADDCTWSLP